MYLSKDYNACWYRYNVEIIPKKRVREGDRIQGELPPLENIPEARAERIERFQQELVKRGSNSTSRAVLAALKANLAKEGIAASVSAKC